MLRHIWSTRKLAEQLRVSQEHAMTIRNSWTLDSLSMHTNSTSDACVGCEERTLQGYEQLIRPFLRFSLGSDPLDLRRLPPTDALQFVASLRDRNQYLIVTRGGTFIHVINGQLMAVYVDDDAQSSLSHIDSFAPRPPL
jgi:hypothetical protein